MRRSAAVAWAVAGSLAAGVALSFAQSALPDALAPVANSATPVVALAAGASLAGRRPLGAAALGAAAGPLAMIAYYAASAVRGFPTGLAGLALWSAAGVAFGSVMGLAAWRLRRGDDAAPAWSVGLAAAWFPGIACGEAAHGLLRIADTTPAGYWWTQAAVGVAVLAWTAGRLLSGTARRAVAVGATAVVATAVFAAFGAA